MNPVQSGPAQMGGRTDGQLKMQKNIHPHCIHNLFDHLSHIKDLVHCLNSMCPVRCQRQTTQCNPVWSSAQMHRQTGADRVVPFSDASSTPMVLTGADRVVHFNVMMEQVALH
jgi:hypothetical protein